MGKALIDEPTRCACISRCFLEQLPERAAHNPCSTPEQWVSLDGLHKIKVSQSVLLLGRRWGYTVLSNSFECSSAIRVITRIAVPVWDKSNI